MEKHKKTVELEQGIEELERKQSELMNEINEMENHIYELSAVKYVFSKREYSKDEEKLLDLMMEKKAVSEERKKRGEIENDIKVLEVMLGRGTVVLMDMQMMEEEIKELKKRESEVGSVMEAKIGELVEGMWELKREIVDVMSRKNKELMSLVESEGENVREERVNWYGVVLALGVVVGVVYKLWVAKPKHKGWESK